MDSSVVGSVIGSAVRSAGGSARRPAQNPQPALTSACARRAWNRTPTAALRRCGLILLLGVVPGVGVGAGLGARPEATAPAVALVTDLAGTGQLRRHGDSRPLAMLDALQPGDHLRLAAGASVELAFTAGAGSVVRLTGPGRFALRADDVRADDTRGTIERRDLAAAWRGLQIRPGLIGRASIALRGFPGNQLALRAPVGAQAAERPPPFEWDQPYGRPVGAWTYVVRLIDDQGALLYSARLGQRRLPVPEGIAWERGRDYLWTVQADAPGRHHATGAVEFHLLAEDAQRRIDALAGPVLQARRDPAQPESAAEEVLLAVAWQQAGMTSAARRQWQALARVRPALADIAAAQR